MTHPPRPPHRARAARARRARYGATVAALLVAVTVSGCAGEVPATSTGTVGVGIGSVSGVRSSGPGSVGPASATAGSAAVSASSRAGGTATSGPATSGVGAAQPRDLPYPELLPRTTGDAPLVLALTRITPTIATPGSPVTVEVTVTNTGLDAARPSLHARVGEPLVNRADLDAPLDVARTTVVSDAPPPPTLAPGASAALRLTIAPERLRTDAPYGVLPLLVRAQDGERSAVTRTYLPYLQRKEYEPLSLAIAMPVTGGPDPALTAPDAAAAEAAWARATAPGARLDRLLTGAAGAAVTLAVDPTVLGPAAPGADPTAPTARPTASGTTPPTTPSRPSTTATPTRPAGATSPAREALTTRLATLARTHPLWALPTADPDLAELLGRDAAESLLARAVAPDDRVATALSPVSLRRVAWPAGALTPDQVRRLDTAYGEHWSGPLVLPLAASQEPGWTGDAARRFGDGPSVVAYDETLSRLLANTAGTPAGDGPGLTQRFLAETMTVLKEYPGRTRRLLIVAPRDIDPDPGTLAGLLGTAASTPWLRATSTEELVGAAQEPDAAAAVAPTDAGSRPAPFPTGSSPLDAESIDDVEEDLARLDGLAPILPDGSATPGAARRATLALLATGWRGHVAAWGDARTAARRRVETLLTGVSVVDKQVNFFAESGIIQVTVVNNLDVDVHDVELRLVPQGRMPRLRLPSTPYVLSIAARSRTTVKVPVEALAAGPTVVSAQVVSPDGTRLGAQDATLTLEVQPSTGRLVIGIGGAAGVIFLVGLLRTIRRNRPRVSAEDLKEIDLE